MNPTSPHYSIIIPVRNEEKLIEHCLYAASHQTFDSSYEILLVDGGSTDKTLSIAKKFPVKIIPQNGKGKVNGIQTGILNAKGSVICFTEADCILPGHWLSVIDRTFSTYPDSIAISGFYTYYDGSLLENALLSLCWPFAVYGYRLIYGNHTLRTSNSAVRSDILKLHKNLDTRFAELYDLDLALRLRKAGKIRFIKNMQVQTSCRRIKGRLLKYIGEITSSVYHVALLRKHVRTETFEHIR